MVNTVVNVLYDGKRSALFISGPQMEKSVEQVLEATLPRYISILSTHVRTIKTWDRAMNRAIYHLLTILVYAENYFTLYLNSELLHALIDNLLRVVSEPTLIEKITRTSNNPEYFLMDAALQVFDALAQESDALNYIQKRKPAKIFEKLLSIPNQAIVPNAYAMLAYTIEKDDIKQSQKYYPRLLCAVLNLLYSAVQATDRKNKSTSISPEGANRIIAHLTETLTGKHPFFFPSSFGSPHTSHRPRST